LRSAIERHDRVAVCFSGGKDSLAVVYMLRAEGLLDRVTIYHNDTGDLLPEVMEIVEHVKGFAPHFVHIKGDVGAWIAANGLPSDIVPYTSHPVAALAGQQRAKIVGRYECCSANLMRPLWDRLVSDGVTLVIRGTKTTDFPTLPVRHGETRDGVEFLHPLEGWSHAQVFDYLRSVGAPICRVYDDAEQAPECARCTAWMNVGQAAYLAKHHPALLRDYRSRMDIVMGELDAPMESLTRELRAINETWMAGDDP
jgi:3'-phosphoadenosine 5'-phosphosulfate sulfotransferase (PAPS reductase)/FAD synthetase